MMRAVTLSYRRPRSVSLPLILLALGLGACARDPGARPAPELTSADRGARLFTARCAECHSVTFEDMGPHLGGVIGRKAGSVAKFRYSAALAKAGFVWDDRHLDAWLSDPEALVPGQRMKEHVSDPAKRADLIAYLHTLSQ
jgi:cytochrome c